MDLYLKSDVMFNNAHIERQEEFYNYVFGSNAGPHKIVNIDRAIASVFVKQQSREYERVQNKVVVTWR